MSSASSTKGVSSSVATSYSTEPSLTSYPFSLVPEFITKVQTGKKRISHSTTSHMHPPPPDIVRKKNLHKEDGDREIIGDKRCMIPIPFKEHGPVGEQNDQ